VITIAPHDPDWFVAPDHYEVLARLRAESPVLEFASGEFVVSTYEEIRAISRDPTAFCSGHGVLVNDPMRTSSPPLVAPSILQMDPPEHTKYRKLVSRAFTPRAVREMEPRIRHLARSLLDDLPLGEEVDAVERIAVPLPVAVIAELLGIPDESRAQFRRWSDAAIAAGDNDPEALRATGELFRFLGEHAAETRRRGGDHLVARLVDAEIDGYRLTDDELRMFCVTLLVAGNETTRHLISGALHALAERPDQLALLRARPELLSGAVEEMLRWTTPVQAFARTATRPTRLREVSIGEGAYVIMLYASGNRDEAAFGPTAHRFDVTRPADPAHVAFGFGQHLCLGASLARLEARVLFEELLARAASVAIARPGRRVRSTIMHGWAELPVRLMPAT